MGSFSVNMSDCFSKELKSSKTSEVWTQKSFFTLLMRFVSVNSYLTFFSVASAPVSNTTESGMAESRVLVLEATWVKVSLVEKLRSLRFDLK